MRRVGQRRQVEQHEGELERPPRRRRCAACVDLRRAPRRSDSPCSSRSRATAVCRRCRAIARLANRNAASASAWPGPAGSVSSAMPARMRAAASRAVSTARLAGKAQRRGQRRNRRRPVGRASARSRRRAARDRAATWPRRPSPARPSTARRRRVPTEPAATVAGTSWCGSQVVSSFHAARGPGLGLVRVDGDVVADGVTGAGGGRAAAGAAPRGRPRRTRRRRGRRPGRTPLRRRRAR